MGSRDVVLMIEKSAFLKRFNNSKNTYSNQTKEIIDYLTTIDGFGNDGLSCYSAGVSSAACSNCISHKTSGHVFSQTITWLYEEVAKNKRQMFNATLCKRRIIMIYLLLNMAPESAIGMSYEELTAEALKSIVRYFDMFESIDMEV